MIEETGSCVKLLTAQGRGRYFLRLALNRKLLAIAVQQLLRASRLPEVGSGNNAKKLKEEVSLNNVK